MTAPKVIVDTDLFADHLLGQRRPSLLREAAGKFFCYTTVFNAIELFDLFPGDAERTAVEDSMGTVKILGLNARNARLYGRLRASHRHRGDLGMLVAGMSLDTKLPLVTGRPGRYRGIPGLRLVDASLIPLHASGTDVLKAASRVRRRSGRSSAI